MDEKNMNNQEESKAPESGMPTPETSSEDTTSMDSMNSEDKSFGPLVGIIIIVVILILGGLYFWGQKVDEGDLPAQDAAIEALEEQGTSDELGAIEEDLDATDLEALDAELSDIEADLSL